MSVPGSTRTSRAAQRVERLLATVPVTDAAKLLALDVRRRAARSTARASGRAATKAGSERLAVQPVQQYVDEVTLPLVTGTEQNALLARTPLAAGRARLDATLLYVGIGPSPATRLALAYAESDGSRGSTRAPAASTQTPAVRYDHGLRRRHGCPRAVEAVALALVT
ncbi:hypothetical protein [Geodermatophilus obscurus]|uniref:hypothetical protein n=1 Tax=Geodermatophilus obscurus TaxID=1861 RepID=UPI00094438F0|nr:hypothetical protein [Geodermatophilus obscurus]